MAVLLQSDPPQSRAATAQLQAEAPGDWKAVIKHLMLQTMMIIAAGDKRITGRMPHEIASFLPSIILPASLTDPTLRYFAFLNFNKKFLLLLGL